MEKGRNSKIFVIVILFVAVFGLSIGFAAYSRNLVVDDIEAVVQPGDAELDIILDDDRVKDNTVNVVKGVGTAAVLDEAGAVITNPVLNSGSKPTISGLRANFTDKGQTVTYTFYVYNNSPYNAYLNELSFTEEPYITCTAVDPQNTNATLVSNACKDISLSLAVDSLTILSTDEGSPVSHTLTPGGVKEYRVIIAYKGTKYPLPDGAMTVNFTPISFGYSTVSPY